MLPSRSGGFGLASASRTAPAAVLASWASHVEAIAEACQLPTPDVLLDAASNLAITFMVG